MSRYVHKARTLALESATTVTNTVLPSIKKSLETSIAKNAEFIVKDEQQAAKLPKQLLYTNLARIPKAIETAEREAGMVKERWQKVDEMSVKEVGVAVLFGLETYAWFCVGEIIGRGGSLTGY
ncbi:unnamed protein product [Bathycoccus prasinos]|mmetsp:Transcript_8657/g.27801  ORF Transcript_8657/g.27801 Transcript_8657/m.27801 type:complete len:123 (-) Transcript_8657:1281-1649(-)